MKRTILLLVSLVFGTGAFAQYPAKPIRLVVPFPAGESVDATARLVGQSWSAALGQQILVDNRGGAGGTIGSEAVARSASDGYTLLWGNVGPLAIGPGLYKKLGYDVAKDFEPVSLVATLPFVLFASPVLPANSITELVAYAKAHPGEINFGSTGVGSGLHLIAELFKSVAGIQIIHVPYKGVAQALPEMMSGKVQIAFNTIPAFLPHVRAGRLKALAITAAERSPLLPDVPAMTEVGLAAVQGGSWHAVVAPVGHTSSDHRATQPDARRDARRARAAQPASESGRAAGRQLARGASEIHAGRSREMGARHPVLRRARGLIQETVLLVGPCVRGMVARRCASSASSSSA